MTPQNKQDGFHVLLLVIVLLAVGVIGLIGYRIVTNGKNTESLHQNVKTVAKDAENTGPPKWEYDREKLEWQVKDGVAPKCEDPLKFDVSPVDMSKVTAIGLPGAYRGFNYKAHGGLRLASDTNGFADIKIPMDAQLKGLKRYLEAFPGQPDEIQYLLDFENDCGIAIRFDHIYTLTPALQAIADSTPPPKKDDTRGDPNAKEINFSVKAGDVIATAVGHHKAKNYGFDFGVYDRRSRNGISHNNQWASIHKNFSASEFHGVCWLPLLPDVDAARAEALAKDRNNYNANKPFNLTSDYCDFAPHKTLEFNNGQPVDG